MRDFFLKQKKVALADDLDASQNLGLRVQGFYSDSALPPEVVSAFSSLYKHWTITDCKAL